MVRGFGLVFFEPRDDGMEEVLSLLYHSGIAALVALISFSSHFPPRNATRGVPLISFSPLIFIV
jgi:hypothetical protein